MSFASREYACSRSRSGHCRKRSSDSPRTSGAAAPSSAAMARSIMAKLLAALAVGGRLRLGSAELLEDVVGLLRRLVGGNLDLHLARIDVRHARLVHERHLREDDEDRHHDELDHHE